MPTSSNFEKEPPQSQVTGSNPVPATTPKVPASDETGTFGVNRHRNTFRLASKKDWNALKRNVKLIHSSALEPALGEFHTRVRAVGEKLTSKR